MVNFIVFCVLNAPTSSSYTSNLTGGGVGGCSAIRSGRCCSERTRNRTNLVLESVCAVSEENRKDQTNGDKVAATETN